MSSRSLTAILLSPTGVASRFGRQNPTMNLVASGSAARDAGECVIDSSERIVMLLPAALNRWTRSTAILNFSRRGNWPAAAYGALHPPRDVGLRL